MWLQGAGSRQPMVLPRSQSDGNGGRLDNIYKDEFCRAIFAYECEGNTTQGHSEEGF